jgi:hypothetical protein
MNQGAWVIVIATALFCMPAPARAAPPVQGKPPAAASASSYEAAHEARRLRLASGLKPALRPKLDATVAEVRKLAQPPATAAGKTAPPPPDLAAVARAALRDLARAENLDIEALVQLVLLEAAKETDQETRALLAELKAANERKAALRAALAAMKASREATRSTKACASLACLDALPPSAEYTQATMTAVKQSLVAVPEAAREDNLNDASTTNQMRIQMVMDRKAKIAEILSHILEKLSDTSQSILQNMK